MADFFLDDLIRRRDETIARLKEEEKVPRFRIDPQWRCQQAGDCCTKPEEVVMTKEEASELVMHAPPEIHMQFRPVDDQFVALKARPCPLYVFKTCLVYEHRPYNCRRFGCMRPDPQSEPFDVGGRNLRDRVAVSPEARRLAVRMQKQAQPWAKAHGWKIEEDDSAKPTS